MMYTVQLQNPWVDKALVKEYHNEVWALKSGKTVGQIANGDDENWVAVIVQLKPLMNFLKNPPDGWAWSPDGTRRGFQRKLIMDGVAIEAPVLYSLDGSKSLISIIDGRHRLAALEILGCESAVIMVPSSQATLFQTTFV